jgi:hypothetical protein
MKFLKIALIYSLVIITASVATSGEPTREKTFREEYETKMFRKHLKNVEENGEKKYSLAEIKKYTSAPMVFIPISLLDSTLNWSEDFSILTVDAPVAMWYDAKVGKVRPLYDTREDAK